MLGQHTRRGCGAAFCVATEHGRCYRCEKGNIHQPMAPCTCLTVTDRCSRAIFISKPCLGMILKSALLSNLSPTWSHALPSPVANHLNHGPTTNWDLQPACTSSLCVDCGQGSQPDGEDSYNHRWSCWCGEGDCTSKAFSTP